MAQTVAAFEAALDTAVTAVAAGNYDTARNSLVQASIIQLSLPRTWVDGAMVDYKGKISDVISVLEVAEGFSNRSKSRLISTRVSHGRRTGRGGRSWNDQRGI